jgi:hypothetical protein
MRSLPSVFLILLFCVGSGHSQQSPAEVTPDAGLVIAPGQFYAKDLDLHFNFPVEMKVVDMFAKIEQGHHAIFGVAGDTDAEHKEANRCVRPLLDAELPEDKAPQRRPSLAPVLPDAPGAKEERPIYAEILFTEVLSDCLPKKLRKNDDAVLFDLAATPTSGPGVAPITKPLWYEIGKQKIHMTAGAGRVSANGRAVTEPLLIMAMATQWHGHVLLWTFTSNDREIFNELTKSVVQFGNTAPAQMFPPNIGPKGAGTPMTVLPK